MLRCLSDEQVDEKKIAQTFEDRQNLTDTHTTAIQAEIEKTLSKREKPKMFTSFKNALISKILSGLRELQGLKHEEEEKKEEK